MSSEKRVLATQRRALRNHVAKLDQADQESAWRALKQTDIVAFNAGAEPHFVDWLTRQIINSKNRSVSIGWVLGNAAYELNLSVHTIKRYLMKYTADAAPFRSDGKRLRLRRRSK